MKKFIFYLSLCLFDILCAKAQSTGNSVWINDSVFYQSGIYYQLFDNPDNYAEPKLGIVDWDPEITNLEITGEVDEPERPGFESANKQSDRVENLRRTRKYKIITIFKPRVLGVLAGDYRVQKILMSVDCEFAEGFEFSAFQFLTTVGLPDNMKEIPPRCFKNCAALKSFTIKKNVEKIGEEAFAGCTNLEYFYINEECRLDEICKSAFEDCCSLKEVKYNNSSSLRLSIDYIRDRAFANCTNLSYLGVKGSFYIWSQAFLNCTSLTELEFGSRTYYIESNAFENCQNINNFIIVQSNDSWTRPNDYWGCYCTYDGCLYYAHRNDGSRSLKFVPAAKSTIIIDSEAIGIGENAFRNNKLISNVYIPDNISVIGDCAFLNCKNLKKCRISERVSNIPDSCFYGCNNLETVNIPESILSIGDFAFADCNGITEIRIPSQTNKIGIGSFGGCQKLNHISVSEWNDNFEVINGMLFDNDAGYFIIDDGKKVLRLLCCPSGLEQIELPSGENDIAIRIADYAFYRCNNIESFNITKDVFDIGISPFAYCENLVSFTKDDENKTFTIVDDSLWAPGQLISFPSGRENACIESFSTDNVTSWSSISKGAFRGCGKLKTVTLKGISWIYNDNFVDCDNIETIDIVNRIPVFEAPYYEPYLHFSDCVYENAQLNYWPGGYPVEGWGDEEIMNELRNFEWITRFKNVNIMYGGYSSNVKDVESENNSNIDYSLPYQVFDFSGLERRASLENLPQGLFIVRQGSKVCKILVK